MKESKIFNSDIFYSQIEHKNSILEKLRPSKKNKIITKKINEMKGNHENMYDKFGMNYFESNTNQNFDILLKEEKSSFSSIEFNDEKFEKMIKHTSDIRNSTKYLNSNVTLNTSTSLKWMNILKKSKEEALKLDLSQSEVLSQTNQFEFSDLSENIDDLNDIIEENYQMVISENFFLRQEYHSILPFFLISSKELHRMCLSDYEIKLVNKTIKNKVKNNRLDWMDYFKKGLIKFYQSKFYDSYFNFKAAYSMKKDEKEVNKWLSFNLLIIIFCSNIENDETGIIMNDLASSFLNIYNEKNSNNSTDFNNSNNSNFLHKQKGIFKSFKIDFSKIKNILIKHEENNNNDIYDNLSDDEENPLFTCCNGRKNRQKIFNVTSIIKNYSKKDQLKQNKYFLCIELEELLNELIEKCESKKVNVDSENLNQNDSKEINYKIEIWWMMMIVSIYVEFHPEQKIFKKIFNPKHCIKKIKTLDIYLGYIAYSEYNYLVNKNFKQEDILIEIIKNYPKRIEGFMKYWNILTKSDLKNNKKALAISEVFWKNSSIIQFDNDVY